MVDSREIEELRALAFASIPSRKAQPPQRGIIPTVAPAGERKRTSDDQEEGEILSDEDAALVMASQSGLAVPNTRSPGGVLSTTNRIEGSRIPVSGHSGVQPFVTVEVPARMDISNTVPGSSGLLRPPSISKTSMPKVSQPARRSDENVSQSATRSRNPVTTASQSVFKPPSSPIALPTSTAGLRKEADAFLASLNIPVASTVPNTGGFTAERNSSLVIKFSDDDSDSDGEQQGQTVRNNSENRKGVLNGLTDGNGTGNQQTSLSSQTTGDLKSEIDRVKRQIAAIESSKGKSSSATSRFSRSSSATGLQPVIAKLGVPTSVNPRKVPVDLENLRKQIAAKESELQLRKQRGIRELLIGEPTPGSACVANTSSSSLPKPDCVVKSDGIMNGVTPPASNNTLVTGDAALHPLKQIPAQKLEKLACKQEQSSVSGVTGQFSTRVSTQGYGMAGVVQPLQSTESSRLVDPDSSRKGLARPQSKDALDKDKKGDDGKMNFTPKRKRNESEQANNYEVLSPDIERVKKQKTKNSLSQSQPSVTEEQVMAGVQKRGENPAASALGNDQLVMDIGAGASLRVRDNSMAKMKESQMSIPVVLECQVQKGSLNEVTNSDLGSVPSAASPARVGEDAIAANVSSVGEQSKSALSLYSMPANLSSVETKMPTDQGTQVNNMTPLGNLEESVTSDMNKDQHATALILSNHEDLVTSNIDKHPSITNTPIGSPSRALIEKHGDSAIIAGSGKGIQGVLVGGTSCSSVPIWNLENQLQRSNMSLFHGISEQSLKLGCDTLRRWREEESLVDKQLEEAQQNRRKCEVRERLARRHYQEAQEALFSANSLCDMLYQKREMLAARIKAAQVHYLSSNKASFLSHVHSDEGMLMNVSSPGYSSGRTLNIGASSLLVRDQTLVNLQISSRANDGHMTRDAVMMDLAVPQSHKGLVSGDQNAIGSAHKYLINENLSLHQHDLGAINAPRDTAVNELEGDHFIPSTNAFMDMCEGDINKQKSDGNQSIGEGSAFSQRSSTMVEGSEDQDQTDSCTLSYPSTGPETIGQISACTLSNLPKGPVNVNYSEGIRETDLSKLSSTSPTLDKVVQAHHAEKHSHHGFSSASFATDLQRNAGDRVHDSLGSGSNERNECATSEKEILLAQHKGFDGDVVGLFHSEIVNCNSECIVTSATQPEVLGKFENQNLIGIHQPSVAANASVECFRACSVMHDVYVPGTFGGLRQTQTETEAVKCLQIDGRIKPSCPNQQMDFKASLSDMDDCSPDHCTVVRMKDADARPVNENSFHGVSIQQLDNSSTDLMNWSNLGDNARNRRVSDVVYDMHAESNMQSARSLQASEPRASLPPLHKVQLESDSEKAFLNVHTVVPSPLLLPVFSQIDLSASEHLSDTEEESSADAANHNNLVAPVCYESPLRGFRSPSHFQDESYLSSSLNTQTYDIDPHKVLCKYEHRGKCNNEECDWQHKRDYLPGSSHASDQFQTSMDCNKVEVMKKPGTDLSYPLARLDLKRRDKLEANDVAASKRSMKSAWNIHLTKVPVYHIGSYLVKLEQCTSPLTLFTCKHQSGFQQSFSMPLPVHRQLPVEMTVLLDASLQPQTLGNDFPNSDSFPVANRLHTEDEGHYVESLEDEDFLLEAALSFIDFNINAMSSEACKNALYILSRGLEAKPSSEALWVVYLHLFYGQVKNIAGDDMFYHAVQQNKGSYELWMMFINSRSNLSERLEAYESAIIAIGSMINFVGQHQTEKSSFLLDLVLQMLNCMCISGLSLEAVSWINQLTLMTTNDAQGVKKHTTSSTLIPLTCMTNHDLCILWICCAYLILKSEVPSVMVESLGCKQALPLHDIWQDLKVHKSCGAHAMKLMHTAASDGIGCLKLDFMDLSSTKERDLSKEAMAVNYVQCAAVCEGLGSSLTLADKFFNLYPTSVELILLRVRLEEHCKGKEAGINIFERALFCWSIHQAGKLQLWNQYIVYAIGVKGSDYLKTLLARCAAEIHGVVEGRNRVTEAFCSTFLSNSEGGPNLTNRSLQLTSNDLDDCIKNAFCLLPSLLKRQRAQNCGALKQIFSYKDAVFGFLNLALFEALNGDLTGALNAAYSCLNISVDVADMQHCLREIAALTSRGVVSKKSSSPSVHQGKLFRLLDRCFTGSQLQTTLLPLSKGLCTRVRNRRVRCFLDHLMGPWPKDFTSLNIILQSFYGPRLLPKDWKIGKDLLDFAEKILELVPNNVRLASSVCRVVQSTVAECDMVSKSALVFWSVSLLVDSLCQSSPEAPEPRWVEAGSMLALLGVDALLEDFYQRALAVYPFSTALWHGLLAACGRTGNLTSALECASRRGVKVDVQSCG